MPRRGEVGEVQDAMPPDGPAAATLCAAVGSAAVGSAWLVRDRGGGQPAGVISWTSEARTKASRWLKRIG
jgi:hypothetical protein